MKFKFNWFSILLMLICAATGVVVGESGVLGADGVQGNNVASGVNSRGEHLFGSPMSLSAMRSLSPDLIENEYDREIVMQFDSAVPIDTILRHVKSDAIRSMTYGYFAVDTRRVSDYVNTTDANTAGGTQKTVGVANPDMFELNDQIMFGGVLTTPGANIVGQKTTGGVWGYVGDGAAARLVQGVPFTAVVVGKTNDATPKLICEPINGEPNPANPDTSLWLAVPENTVVYRISPLYQEAEDDPTTINSLPTPKEQNMQIFMNECSETLISQMHAKNANFGEAELRRIALYQTRKEIEAAVLFSVKRSFVQQKSVNGKKRTIYTTHGIKNQLIDAGRVWSVQESNFTEKTLVDMMDFIYTGNSGSPDRYMFAGNKFINTLSKIEDKDKRRSQEQEKVFGYTWSKIKNNFGTLYLYPHPLFREFGEQYNAIVLDMEYVSKRVFLSFSEQEALAEKNGYKLAGARRKFMEICSVILKYPEAHAYLQIIPS